MFICLLVCWSVMLLPSHWKYQSPSLVLTIFRGEILLNPYSDLLWIHMLHASCFLLWQNFEACMHSLDLAKYQAKC